MSYEENIFDMFFTVVTLGCFYWALCPILLVFKCLPGPIATCLQSCLLGLVPADIASDRAFGCSHRSIV